MDFTNGARATSDAPRAEDSRALQRYFSPRPQRTRLGAVDATALTSTPTNIALAIGNQ